jgi:hypothetical protein
LTYTLSASKTQLVLKEISSGYTSILTSDNFTDQTIPSSLIIVIQGAGGSGSQTFSTSRGTQHGAGGGSGGIASIVVKIDNSSATLTEVIRIVVAGSTAAFDHAGGDTTLTCTYKGVTTTLLVPGGSCPSSSTGGLAGNRATYTVSNTTSPNSWLLGSLPGEAGGSGGATTYQSGVSTAGGKVFSTRASDYTDYFADYPAGVYLAFGNFAGGTGLIGNTGGAGGAASYFASGGGHTVDDTDHLASKGSGGMGSTNINRSKGGAA